MHRIGSCIYDHEFVLARIVGLSNDATVAPVNANPHFRTNSICRLLSSTTSSIALEVGQIPANGLLQRSLQIPTWPPAKLPHRLID